MSMSILVLVSVSVLAIESTIPTYLWCVSTMYSGTWVTWMWHLAGVDLVFFFFSLPGYSCQF